MNSQHASLGNCALSTLVSLVVSVFTVTGQAKAQCQYEVTILQFPIECGIGTVITTGLSLNENGAVVGRYKCPVSKYSQGFLWTAEGGFVGLQPPPGVIEVVPTDINDQGVICGTIIVSGLGYRGFVYDHGVWTVLPPVVDMLGTWSSAAAINNDGIVVGQRSITENLNPQNAYIWSTAEGFTDLGVMSGPNSAATAISESGLVAGWTGGNAFNRTAFLWEMNTRVLGFFPKVPDVITSFSTAVNSRGDVTGVAGLEPDGSPDFFTRGFVWSFKEVTLLEPLRAFDNSYGYDISAQNVVVGFSRDFGDSGTVDRAVIWHGDNAIDLNALLRPDVDVTLTFSGSVNSQGQIRAVGYTAAGDVVSFLLTPIDPSPADLDGDCDTDVSDLFILLDQWGQPNSPADFDADGLVGILDLLFLLANWG